MVIFGSMRSWESARPLERVGRGSDSQDHMDHGRPVFDTEIWWRWRKQGAIGGLRRGLFMGSEKTEAIFRWRLDDLGRIRPWSSKGWPSAWAGKLGDWAAL